MYFSVIITLEELVRRFVYVKKDLKPMKLMVDVNLMDRIVIEEIYQDMRENNVLLEQIVYNFLDYILY
jgi:hypothetical protein